VEGTENAMSPLGEMGARQGSLEYRKNTDSQHTNVFLWLHKPIFAFFICSQVYYKTWRAPKLIISKLCQWKDARATLL